MPFVPIEPEKKREPCRSPEHYPPAHVVITERVKWRCPECGREVILEPAALQMVTDNRPTKPEVRKKRSQGRGCCDRYCDNMACRCLRDAAPCPTCGDSGYAVHPLNGKRVGVRCPEGCPVECSVCNDPNCDNPGGQH